MMNDWEATYRSERVQFWADVVLCMVVIGAAAVGFFMGAWFAVASLIDSAT